MNIMNSGNGVGLLLALNVVTPFLMLNSNKSISGINGTNIVSADDIKLQTPYSIIGGMGIICAIGFCFAQYYELKYRATVNCCDSSLFWTWKIFSEYIA